jgi:FkbM family methyltransferase
MLGANLRYKWASVRGARAAFRNWLSCVAIASPQTRWGWPPVGITWRTRAGPVFETMPGERGCWVPNEVWGMDAYGLAMLRRLGPRTVLDIGANVGAFSLAAAINFPSARIVAVEPAPDTFAYLVGNVRRNGLLDRIECLQAAAVGAADVRQAYVTVQPKDSVTTSTSLAPQGPQSLTVPARRLSDLIAGLKEVDLLKIDAEGAEYEILENTPAEALTPVSVIVLEYHPRPERSWRHLARVLVHAGMRCVAHDLTGGCGMLWAARSHDLFALVCAIAQRPILDVLACGAADAFHADTGEGRDGL